MFRQDETGRQKHPHHSSKVSPRGQSYPTPAPHKPALNGHTVQQPPSLSMNMTQRQHHKIGKKEGFRASLVAQWLRIRLPMQGTRVRALVWEDPTCRGATRPVHHNYWACALEPISHNYSAHEPQLLSPCATTTEARAPRARALPQEKPPQWDAHTLQRRVAPACRN